jgi:uracil-DNA glycosylase
MPTFHPAFLLRSYTVENRQAVWSDLQKVMEAVGLDKKGRKVEEPV